MSSSKFGIAERIWFVVFVVLAAIPLQFLFLLLALFLGGTIVHFLLSAFSLLRPSSLSLSNTVSNFLEAWTLGIPLYLVNLTCYIVFATAAKVKPRYTLLSTLAIAFIFLAIINANRTPRGFFDFGQFFADAFLSSMALFAVFTLSSVLLDKFSGMREWVKILLSFVLSLPIGSILAFRIWMVF